jgi:threonine dehydrogenase-like Zn-dependent dehydrogenase
MRAAFTKGMGETLVIENIAEPSPAADELLVRVEACGICGSDLHMVDNMDLRDRVLGHEFAGVVAGFGKEVEGFAEGDRIAAFPLFGCGTCLECLSGRPARCVHWKLTGGDLPGAYAEYVTIKPRQAYALPDEVSLPFGAMVEPLAVGLHGWTKTPAEAGEPVLIVGAGPVGQSVALWANHFGAREVVVADLVAHRRALAMAAGATSTIDPADGDVAEQYADITGEQPRVVIECVGVPGMIENALKLARADGHVTVVGMCIGPDQITPMPAMVKELTTQFVLFYRVEDFRLTISSLKNGTIDPTPLLTATFGLDELPTRFDALKHPTTECKLVIEPQR